MLNTHVEVVDMGTEMEKGQGLALGKPDESVLRDPDQRAGNMCSEVGGER